MCPQQYVHMSHGIIGQMNQAVTLIMVSTRVSSSEKCKLSISIDLQAIHPKALYICHRFDNLGHG